MIRIICHNDNKPERQYSIDVLFSVLLGISKEYYEIQFDEKVDNYIIQQDNRTVIVEDCFFRLYPEPLSYLNLSCIPSELRLFHFNDLAIPIIYGEDKYEDNESGSLIGLDVFASTFFMLSRWEEYLLGREETGDCDESLLFTVKNGIHQCPLVHEYESLLRVVLGLPPTTRKYQVVLSHDVDGFITPSYLRIIKDFFRQSVKGAPKNKILNLTWKEEIKYKRTYPFAYDQFQMYRALSKKYEIPQWLYFKVCDKGEKECTYRFNDPIVGDIINRLKHENSFIQLGFHPSQSTFDNPKQWEREVSRIKFLLGGKPGFGRNHHLLFNTQMLRNWEHLAGPNEMFMLSNVVFHNRLGFRSGVAVPYPIFDIYQRRQMRILEYPCQIMDTVVRYASKVKNESEIMKEIETIISSIRRYRGELVLTWHIYIRNANIINTYYHWCTRILNYAVSGKSN